MVAAVDECWGGRDSHLKAERTVSNVLNYFIHLKDPTMGFDELADILENGLDELNTDARDGRVEEVTKTLLGLYYECNEGNYQRVVENLRVTSSQPKASVVKVSNGNDEDDEESDDDDDDDDDDTHMSNDQSTNMIVDASDHSSNLQQEAMPVDEPKANDDRTVVTSRKNKGKRN